MTTYLTDNEGKFIPATQRPDGTWRKARRVKEGYVPQEEVPLYESKGKQFAQRKSTLPPGMCPQVVEQAKKEREKQERAKAKKEAAAGAAGKKSKQQQSQPTPGVLVLPAATKKASSNASKTTNAGASNHAASSTNAPANDVDALSKELQATLTVQEDAQELAKKLKKLRKKLREIETIEEKIKSGELKKPEKDQLDKVKRKKEVQKEIRQLEKEEAEALQQRTQGSD